jgi:hypothetical protein
MDAATVPDRIVAVAAELAAELAGWARAHPTATLAEHERGVLAIFRRAMGPALGAVVARAQGLERPATRRLRESCPDCGARRKPHDPARARQVLTICGAVRLARPYYYCGPCRRGWAPTDARLGLGRRATLSAGATAWVARAGAATPFRAAAGLLEELGGLAVGAETVRAHAEGVGAALAAARAAAAEHVEAEWEPPGPVEAPPGLLVVQADGAQLRYTDAWHEVKLGLVAGCTPGREPAGAAPGSSHALLEPSYVAVRAPAAEFGPLLLAEAARRGALEVVGWEPAPGDDPGDPRVPPLAVLPQVVVLGDGAPWIWGLAAEHFGRRVEILDWFHAKEHLWAAAHALHGDGTPAAAAWVARAEALLWDGGSAPLRHLLDEAVAPTPAAAAGLRRERGYFAANASQLPVLRARRPGDSGRRVRPRDAAAARARAGTPGAGHAGLAHAARRRRPDQRFRPGAASDPDAIAG